MYFIFLIELTGIIFVYAFLTGTEGRQRLLHDPLVSTPNGLKHVLEDPILLQNYFVDADWKSATMSLMYTLPDKDPDGNIIPSPVGGRRRIDFLLHRKEDQTVRVHSHLAFAFAMHSTLIVFNARSANGIFPEIPLASNF